MAQQTKAAYYTEFGGIDKLQVGPLDLPELGAADVQVLVQAAGINPVDAIVREGKFAPVVPSAFPTVPGWDVCGIVEKCGPEATRLPVGTEVYGYVRQPVAQHGTFAERIVVPEQYLTKSPEKLSWVEAGGLPLVGLTAYQSVIKAGQLKAGETVLILGASGGVGSAAIQLAKDAGARVLAVASAENADYMTKLGADETIDYKAGPVADTVKKLAPEGVDLLFDAISGDTLAQSLATLKPNGRLISVLNDGKSLSLPASVRFQHVMAQPSVADLDHLRELADAGKLTVPIAATFALDDVKKAFEQIESHHTTGKVVIVPQRPEKK
ncbi:NADP-dependent oxidoreductase [Hymenobacter ginsengisoli]|uniref:NADP-dependent oxidoreductase n=1 Tax=Hymenobacter ginsengisoli TaxID=1051626 RepID=A0ABP8QPI0_9BACT|nr:MULTISPECIES: NADP-dependent oxidoreductase [unclassified Hymenobacter]MBO2031086.1 NADP-dependent oxidoreductase [Hymenobacter sp. BT559]